MIYYIGIGINVFLLLILISRKGKNTGDTILMGWLSVIAVHSAFYIVSLEPVSIHTIYWILATTIPFPLLHGPFLYLYTAASTNMLPAKKWTWALHFLPAILTFIYLLPIYMLSAEAKINIYLTKGEAYKTTSIVLGVLIKLSGLLYISWSFLLLRRHKKNIGEQFSYEEKINLNWLRYLIYGLLVIWAVIILLKKNSLIFGAGVLFITLLGFLGIRQVGIFGPGRTAHPDGLNNGITDNEKEVQTEANTGVTQETIVIEENIQPENSEPIAPRRKYLTSGLQVKAADEMHKKLLAIMESDKLFKEPELSLAMLAGKLEVHPNYLSQVINQREGKSFFDYINNLRVEEFKRLVALPANSQFTIIGLAYDCGFNSKSSFNKNFRKATGESPSEYLDRLRNH